MSEILHDVIDSAEDVAAKARDEVRGAYANVRELLRMSVQQDEGDTLMSQRIVSVLAEVARLAGERLDPVTTEAAKRGWELGRKVK